MSRYPFEEEAPSTSLPTQQHHFASENPWETYLVYRPSGSAVDGPGIETAHGVSSNAGSRASLAQSTLEQSKHRRSRKGCFTCRHRRVKCDETRPRCDRCRKSSRDCVFPELSDSAKGIKAPKSKNTKPSPDSSADRDAREASSPSEASSHTESQSVPTSPQSSFLKSSSQLGSVAGPGSEVDAISSPLSSLTSLAGITFDSCNQPPLDTRIIDTSGGYEAYNELSSTAKFYLQFYRTHMTYHHYKLAFDHQNFVHDFLLRQALSHQPLLHALIAYAAHYHAVSTLTFDLGTVFEFYGKAMSLLRICLQGSQQQGIPTLLTILQLALLEEHLGDRFNVLNHQQAAFKILAECITPQVIRHGNHAIQKILEWYKRFDIYASILCENQQTAGIEWSDAQHDYFLRQRYEEPNDLSLKYEEKFASLWQLTDDVSPLALELKQVVAADGLHGSVLHSFGIRASALYLRYDQWLATCDPALFDPAYKTHDALQDTLLKTESDSTDDHDFIVYEDHLMDTNHLMLRFWTSRLRFHGTFDSILVAAQQNTSSMPFASQDLVALSLRICRMVDYIVRVDGRPGAAVNIHGSVVLASFFLSTKPQAILWCRQQLAKVESLGFVYPGALRRSLSRVWGVDVIYWWLPDDYNGGHTGELLRLRTPPPIVRAARSFHAFREVGRPSNPSARNLLHGSGGASGTADTDTPQLLNVMQFLESLRLLDD